MASERLALAWVRLCMHTARACMCACVCTCGICSRAGTVPARQVYCHSFRRAMDLAAQLEGFTRAVAISAPGAAAPAEHGKATLLRSCMSLYCTLAVSAP